MLSSDLFTIHYLKSGNLRQRRVYDLLMKHEVVEKMKSFDPVLAGTVPLEIDIDGSDLDIICQWNDRTVFISALQRNFSSYPSFEVVEKDIRKKDTVMARFKLEEFAVEIFGQNTPVREQEAVRHMLTEQQILLTKGESFRQQVIALKQQGYKTEPAFAMLLGLQGDPYVAMLHYPLIPSR